MKNVTYINAGAGSGKTHRLTELLTEKIRNKEVKPEEVILTTFTTKAAGEFKEKAKSSLYKEGMFDEASRLDQAMIGTVHGVCQRIINKYWFTLGLSPNMGVMAEDDTTFYISQSLSDLPNDDELKQLHDFARDFGFRVKEGNVWKETINYDFWQDQLKDIISFSSNYELSDYNLSEKKSLEFIGKLKKIGLHIAITDEDLKTMLSEAVNSVNSNNRIKKKEEYIQSFKDVESKSYNKNFAWFQKVAETFQGKYGPTCEAVQEMLAELWMSEDVYEAQRNYIQLMFKLALRWKDQYAQFKREKNLLDYNDMEKYMALLMQDEAIKKEISKSYRYLFVDEFQDSSPIQVKIFDALSDLMERSYWVGDYKQAIYGFRGSDTDLTKAVVDRISQKNDGCETERLKYSWRSLPEIVDVNNAVFSESFKNKLSPDDIKLTPKRENINKEICLRYFKTEKDGMRVSDAIAKLLRDGALANEIAVLARTNTTLSNLSQELKESYGIPSNIGESPIEESQSYLLVKSLLRLVDSSRDTYAKAHIAMLSQPGFTTKELIETRILNIDDEMQNDETFLSDVPLIKSLESIRPKLQQQSISSMVESLIIELNLFNVVKGIEADPGFGISSLQTIINAAKSYEDHCIQMCLPATIDGYISYIKTIGPTVGGDENGVQLLTYHSCKGLQWKYVILTSLNNDVTDTMKIIGREVYGVHFAHTDQPTAENPYPEVYIRITPWIFSTKKNIPDEIYNIISGTPECKIAEKRVLDEENRLLYVGMTRPQDVLILHAENPSGKKPFFKWFNDEGMTQAGKEIPESGNWDALGTSHIFHDYSVSAQDLETLQPYGQKDERLSMRPKIGETNFEERPTQYISPSKIHDIKEVKTPHDFEMRIPFGQSVDDMSKVGDCIHQIYASIDSYPDIKSIIYSYQLDKVLTDSDSIVKAWKNLVDYLTQQFGEAKTIYHERPFRLKKDGQTMIGSIDLVWQTDKGDILVDFKTCPMGKNIVMNPQSDHYAGKYAGQLAAYESALQESGEQVLHKFIYYPVNGLLVEIP